MERTDSEALAFMVRSAQEEYRQVAIERRGLQYGLVKQYLWLSTLLASGAFALWTRPIENCLPFVFVCALALCLLTSFAAFAIALFCLKGRGLESPPYDRGWKDFAALLHDDTTAYTIEDIHNAMLQHFSIAIPQACDVVKKRALRLRQSCRLLLVSGAALAIAAIVYGWSLRHVG